MIQIEIYSPELYPVIEKWWTGHGWPAVPEQILPKLGVVAKWKEQPVAAAWLYMDNSIGVSMMEWIVSNPEAPQRAVGIAICSIVEFLKAEAKSLGYGVMLSTCQQESLSKLLCRQGFEVTDRNVIHHISIL